MATGTILLMGNFEEALQKLNDEQRQAVLHIDGPVLVLAGPGTGKTQLLSVRAAHILAQTQLDPHNILCLTFTESAARNMRERLAKLIGQPAYHVTINTFHGFGSDVIQRYPEYFLDQPLVQPITELGTYQLIRSIFDTLGHQNPLHKQLGDDYLHLSNTQQVMSWLQQAGLTPKELRQIAKQNDTFIKAVDPLVTAIFATATSTKNRQSYQQLLEAASRLVNDDPLHIGKRFCNSLQDAIQAIPNQGRYAPSMTNWRNEWLVQTAQKQWVCKDKRSTKFLHALSQVYEQYQSKLTQRGWYDYDDMILRVSQKLAENSELRLMIQEQYQYIMVDEFQDTSGSQNRLLEQLADNPVHEGRPNILVVGDDDQGIYRFQGADNSTMASFQKRWKSVETIVLKQNYRSNNQILTAAQSVIQFASDRLVQQLPTLTKTLVPNRAANSNLRPIWRPLYVTEQDQYFNIAQDIKNRIKAGQSPDSIAVIAPQHRQLQALVPYLLDQAVPVRYERRENILDQPKINELINLAKLVDSITRGDWVTANSLIPTVLSAEYWGIPPQAVWQLSLATYQNKQDWLSEMEKSSQPIIRQFGRAIPNLASKAVTESADLLLDIFLGNQPVFEDWFIPYREHYFSAKQLSTNAQDYFKLLGQLNILRNALKNYAPGKLLMLSDLVQFIETYQQSGLYLRDTNPHNSAQQAVELMTGYRAKGLEWDTVYLLSVQDEVWGRRAKHRSGSYSLPTNIQFIRPTADTPDDAVRLFFVAITRAKDELILASYQRTADNQQTTTLEWLLDNPAFPPAQETGTNNPRQLIKAQELFFEIPTKSLAKMQDSLQPVLESYQLNATHFTSFFDIQRGGPQHFFYQHLLHFPEAPTEASIYGTIIHYLIHTMHLQYSHNAALPPLKQLLKTLRSDLSQQPLSDAAKIRLTERGEHALTAFYSIAKKHFTATDKSEYSFKEEGCRLGAARLSGKLDVMRVKKDGLEIIDYKTGSALHNWKPKDQYPQIRAHLYRQQLIFYKILAETSTHFRKLPVSNLQLCFVEPNEEEQIQMLNLLPSAEEVERTKALIKIVWQKIMNLDFPAIDTYKPNQKGLTAFEDDLLAGKI